MTIRQFRRPPHRGASNDQLAYAAHQLFDGKIDAIGEVTLRANETTTTITDSRISTQTFIDFMPLTEVAADEKAGKLHVDTAPMYVSSQTGGSAVVTHSNDSSTTRTFRYVLLG
jgi:hypothetical protein